MVLTPEQTITAERSADVLMGKALGLEGSRKPYGRDIEAMRRNKWKHVTTPVSDSYDVLTVCQKATVQRHLVFCAWCRWLAFEKARLESLTHDHTESQKSKPVSDDHWSDNHDRTQQ